MPNLSTHLATATPASTRIRDVPITDIRLRQPRRLLSFHTTAAGVHKPWVISTFGTAYQRRGRVQYTAPFP
jgi:hypothetical protein